MSVEDIQDLLCGLLGRGEEVAPFSRKGQAGVVRVPFLFLSHLVHDLRLCQSDKVFTLENEWIFFVSSKQMYAVPLRKQ